MSEAMASWFVLRNENVTGPYSTEEVKTLAAQGEIHDKDLIWGRLQAEWKSLGWWMVELTNLLSNHKEPPDNRLWHFAAGGASFGPFQRAELIEKLKEHNLNEEILVWTKGMKAWAPIYEFNDLLDDIGVNKRQFPRAEIDGEVEITIGMQKFKGKLLTISEGGFGANGLGVLTVGQTVPVEISSDSFYDPINAKAEVRYFTDSGYIGFRFSNLNMEGRSKIIQYVKNIGRTFSRAA